MKKLIWQFWNGGPLLPGSLAGSANMATYAERIGADYRFDENAYFTRGFCDNSKVFDKFRPLYDEAFHRYDRVAFVDLDVFAVDGLMVSIFDEPCAGLAMAEEPDQPAMRENTVGGPIRGANDYRWASLVKEKWGIDVPRDSKGRVRIFNSGVMLWTREGLAQARESFIPFQEYIDEVNKIRLPSFYAIDQNYVHAMAFAGGVGFSELSVEWNRQIHYMPETPEPRPIYDRRNAATKFVHVQLRAADHHDAAWHWMVVNRPNGPDEGRRK